MCIWYVYMTVSHAYSYGMYVLHAYIDNVANGNERKLVHVFCPLWARFESAIVYVGEWMNVV
jgi:hypothetical protein